MEIHLSRVNKSSIKLLTNEELDINGNIDLISKNKSAHIRVESPKSGYSHVGDVKYIGAQQLLSIDSKTNKSGKPYITIEGQFSPHIRSVLIIKKIKSADNVLKFECFYDKENYGLVIHSSRFIAFVEGQNIPNQKIFGKFGYSDKWNNYKHRSNYNVTNGVLFIDSVSNKGKKLIRKLDVVIGLKQISSVKSMTPEVDMELIVNPLGLEKTGNFKWISSRYHQKSIIKIIPMEYFKFESLSQRQVYPYERFKIDAIYDVNNDSFISFSVPRVEWSTRKTKSLRPKVIFNVTFDGCNEIQEYDVKQKLHPITNAFIVLSKYVYSIIN
jgi:hypothetical protein